MKVKTRVLLALLAISCAILLAGCGETTMYGEVNGVRTDPQTGNFIFTLERDGGKPITVVTDGDTHIFSWLDEVSEFDLRNGAMGGIMVSVTGKTSGTTTMNASEVAIDQLLIRNTYTLDDGTAVNTLIGSSYTMYCLEDGTELLHVRQTTGPDHVYVGGVESLDDLSQEAQQRIQAYYDEQGILYDEFQTLQEAYDAYYILKEDFRSFMLSQEMTPTASNDEIIYFLTVVTMPDQDHGGSAELRLGAAFDKETGEVIPYEDLFTCQPEEIVSCLAEICGVDDDALIREMKASFKPEYVVFFPDSLDLTFPATALPEYGVGYGMGCGYTEEACALLQPWAVPHGSGQE